MSRIKFVTLIMKDGKVVEEGLVYEVFSQPKHEFSRHLVQAIQLIGDYYSVLADKR